MIPETRKSLMTVSRLQASGRAFAHIAGFYPEITAFRRDLHAHPELGFEEVYTSGRVKEALKACGVDEIHTGIGKTGVVGVIRGASSASGICSAMRVIPIWRGCGCWPNWSNAMRTR